MQNTRCVGAVRKATVPWKMTQSAHTVNTVCLTQHCTNICSQEISVMFKYGWQALQGPQGINHEHLFIPSHLKSFLFSHLLAYSFHKPHSSDFKPIIFSIILLEGCVNVGSTAPSSRRCGAPEKLISPAPQKAACVLNV